MPHFLFFTPDVQAAQLAQAGHHLQPAVPHPAALEAQRGQLAGMGWGRQSAFGGLQAAWGLGSPGQQQGKASTHAFQEAPRARPLPVPHLREAGQGLKAAIGDRGVAQGQLAQLQRLWGW